MSELPYATPDLPGSGGTLRASPEDFRVDEVPAYLPSGAGPHLYVRIEKRGRTTPDVLRTIARALGVPARDAGYAGLKDRDAVTTQWLSFPVARDPDAAALEAPGLRVLEISRHANKLRTGHVRANRFSLAVRGGDLARWLAAELGSTQCREITQTDFSSADQAAAYVRSGGIDRCRLIAGKVARRVRLMLEAMRAGGAARA